jgi:ketosteroid isomerase-like protein
MAAKSPEEICRLFQEYMGEGDIESVLRLYAAEAVFLNQSGEMTEGRRPEEACSPCGGEDPVYFRIRKIIQSGDIALMHTDWQVSTPQPM